MAITAALRFSEAEEWKRALLSHKLVRKHTRLTEARFGGLGQPLANRHDLRYVANW
jgi:hypothetical protein